METIIIAAKPKSKKKSVTDLPKIKPPIEKEVNKKDSEKASIVKSTEASVTKEAVDPVENQLKNSINKAETPKQKLSGIVFHFPNRITCKFQNSRRPVWQREFMLRKTKFFAPVSIYLPI